MYQVQYIRHCLLKVQPSETTTSGLSAQPASDVRRVDVTKDMRARVQTAV